MRCIGRLAPFQPPVLHGSPEKCRFPANAWNTLHGRSTINIVNRPPANALNLNGDTEPRRREPALSSQYVGRLLISWTNHIYGLRQSELPNGVIRLRRIGQVAEKRTFLTSPVVDATPKFWYNAAYVIA
jgi:hypothetical protein